MARWFPLKDGKGFVNEDHVIAIKPTTSLHYHVAFTVDNESHIISIDDDDLWRGSAIPAQPGFIGLERCTDVTDSSIELLQLPIIAWEVAKDGDCLVAAINAEGRRAKAVLEPGGKVIDFENDTCYDTYESYWNAQLTEHAAEKARRRQNVA